MRKVFYYFIKYFFYLTTRLYFRKVKVYGLNNLPKDGGILFSPNHQGAFLDPLLVGSNISKTITSLTRGDVFGGSSQWFMNALKMMPVYRIRNGYSNLKKNDAIFKKCRELLKNKECIMMFSEAAHHNEYFLQTLSKGSSRLAFEAQLDSTESPIYIVPVGINYGHHQIAYSDLHLVYGKPISVNKFLNTNNSNAENINDLRKDLGEKMKQCLWLPEKNDKYFERKKMIIPTNTKLDFYELKRGIEKGSLKTVGNIKKFFSTKASLFKLIIFLLSLPNFLPLFIIKNIISKFKDIVFYSSIKFSLGPIIFTFWWLFTFYSAYIYYGYTFATIIDSLILLSLYLRQNLLLYNKQ